MSRQPTVYGSRHGGGGLPPWLVFIIAVALVFGGYYLWIGIRDFLESGGLGVMEATERAAVIQSATAEFGVSAGGSASRRTPVPTPTPVPPCQEFAVIVEVAIVRASPNTTSPVLDQIPGGEAICVIEYDTDAGWYLIDLNPRTNRLDTGYMADFLIEALNPTPTPSNTVSPAPTVTDLPSDTPSITEPPTITLTPSSTSQPSTTPTPDASQPLSPVPPSPSVTPVPVTPTPPMRSA